MISQRATFPQMKRTSKKVLASMIVELTIFSWINNLLRLKKTYIRRLVPITMRSRGPFLETSNRRLMRSKTKGWPQKRICSAGQLEGQTIETSSNLIS
jgi:hypothetical protein